MVFTFGQNGLGPVYRAGVFHVDTIQYKYSCSLTSAYLPYSISMSPVIPYLEGGCIAGGIPVSLVSQASSSHQVHLEVSQDACG